MSEKLLTVMEVAERLNVSRSTVNRMILEGALPVVRIRAGKRKNMFRVRPEVLEAWIKKQEKL